MAKVGRNKPCPCGSGQKFKKCHGAHKVAWVPPPGQLQARLIARHQAAVEIRNQQQGFGRPIVEAKLNDHQLVAVNNTIYGSKNWKTFPDFLQSYIKRRLGYDWGKSELNKPLQLRHPIFRWYDAYCNYQKTATSQSGIVKSLPLNGVVACYLGLAYSVYLLDNNVELQERLVKRLKDPGNFQGAYYELIVANALIRAGFELSLEDESDPRTKHCEFAALSRETGERFLVEAKMRGVSGHLGRTDKDGTSKANPLSSLISQLNGALAKPSSAQRLIFLDLNDPVSNDCAQTLEALTDRIARRLERFEEHDLPEGTVAYVFVTNMAFHHHLDDPPRGFVYPHGLGIGDFNRPGEISVREAYRQELKHSQVLKIAEALAKYPRIPATFDGSLPAETFHGAPPRPMVGEEIAYLDGEQRDRIGLVTTATVVPEEKVAYLGVSDAQGGGLIRYELSEAELTDYLAHPSAYFGQDVAPHRAETPYDLFKFFLGGLKDCPRDRLLERLAKSSDIEKLAKLPVDDLRLIYAERLTAAVAQTHRPSSRT